MTGAKGSGVGAVVLAAGGGTRFAPGATRPAPGSKLRVPFRGRPLVAWALDAAAGAGLAATAVVVGATPLDDLVPPGIVAIGNPRWAEGQATSLAAAVAWARALDLQAIVVALADQPLVTAAAWRAVAAAPGPIAVAAYGDRRGHPVRLDRAIWPSLPTTGDEGARGLMRRRPDLVTLVPCSGDPADVDTVADLRRLS